MGRNHKKLQTCLFTITAQLVLKRGICRLWCEIALPSCSSVDYAPNDVQGPFPEVWQSSLLQLLPLRLQNSGGDGIFFELQVKEFDLCAVQKQTPKYPDPCVQQTSANVVW